MTAPLSTRSGATAATSRQVDTDRTLEPEASVSGSTIDATPAAAAATTATTATTLSKSASASAVTSVSMPSETTRTTPPAGTADAATTASAVTNDAASSAAPALTAHQPQAPTTPAPNAAVAVASQAAAVRTGGSGQQGGESAGHGAAHDGGHAPARASAISDPSDDTTTPVDAQTFAAAAADASSATVPSNTAMPANIHPGDVVSQIAHQADLFRLPGNRGVRIQLHPEDLGGVQVTVRSATGSLVEAGWTQLRDALATQGISPDRLVMSITSPSGATQMDFSSSSNGSGSGNFRADQGLASFTQGGQSGQRDGNASEDAAFATRRWTSGPDPVANSDDSPRGASSAVAASRIDYRV